MNFLKQKFFDNKNIINSFLTNQNQLLDLEKKPEIDSYSKKTFVKNFIAGLIEEAILEPKTVNAIDDTNAWSIDFPSWYGNFNEKKGKQVMIIGSEPHIHFKYLQTVYHLNNEKHIDEYLINGHKIFNYASKLISKKLNLSQEAALRECYLTDLFPLAPFRGNGKNVGSPENIQKAIGQNGKWEKIRYTYAKNNLISEIENVKPRIILSQGKAVFKEIIKILNVSEDIIEKKILTQKGNNQIIRFTKWRDIEIVSVPHIGSQRMGTFWKQNLENVLEVI